MKKISIITPVYAADQERANQLIRCIESVKNQTYDHNFIEHIIINDGSSYPLFTPNYPWIKIIEQQNLQRLTAYNNGFKASTGDIICMLDSDDEYVSEALEKISEWYKKYPKYEMFNFGCSYVHKDGGTNKRDAYKPKKEKVGHEIFGGGKIVNGTFVFSRKVYQTLGAFPEGIKTIDVPWYKNTELFWTSPYDFSAYAQVEFPEIQPYFQVKHPDHPKGLPKELGNPYGQDYYLFYKYTRKYHSKPIDEYLEVVHLK